MATAPALTGPAAMATLGGVPGREWHDLSVPPRGLNAAGRHAGIKPAWRGHPRVPAPARLIGPVAGSILDLYLNNE